MIDSTLVSPQEGFLNLLQHYGLKVDDTVHFTSDERADFKDQQVAAPALSATGAGSILVAKICDALAKRGYDDDTVQKVGGLVIRNLITGESTRVGKEESLETTIEEGGAKEVGWTVELIIKGLLDKNVQRSRTVHMNSNEPVLLINCSDRTENDLFHHAVEEAVHRLQQDWNIWPVRVYAGPYFPAHGAGLSITLLNVVNTNIGGPSMVQLLDEPSDAPEWHVFVRREAWRDRDLISREEGSWKTDYGTEDLPDDGSEHSLESSDVESHASEQDLAILESPVETESPSAGTTGNAQEETMVSTSRLDGAPEEKQDTDDEEAAFVALKDEHEQESPKYEEQNAPERRISHPSWERRHDSISLIDLIRSQALDIPPLGTAEERVESLDKAAAEPLPSEPEHNDEESFVVL